MLAESRELEASAERKEEVRKRTLSIIRDRGVKAFELAALLTEISDGTYWSEWGFQTFDAYCQKEIGKSKQSAFRLIGIYRTFGIELGMTPEDFMDLDWSKMETILPVVTPQNIKSWLKDTKLLTYDQLREKVREWKAIQAKTIDSTASSGSRSRRAEGASEDDDEHGDQPIVTFTARMYQEQHDNLTAALELAETIAQSKKKNHLLDVIALEFQSSHVEGDDGGLQRLYWWCQQVERVFPGASISVDFAEDSPLYAQFVADRTAAEGTAETHKAQRAAQKIEGAHDPETGEPLQEQTKKKGRKKKDKKG